jgi:hypothetical protein
MIEGCGIDNGLKLKELQNEANSIVGVLVKARKNTEK